MRLLINEMEPIRTKPQDDTVAASPLATNAADLAFDSLIIRPLDHIHRWQMLVSSLISETELPGGQEVALASLTERLSWRCFAELLWNAHIGFARCAEEAMSRGGSRGQAESRKLRR